MKLIYKILWFEDQFDEIEAYIEELKPIITEAGFVPEIVPISTISEEDITGLASQLDNYNPYDLIIFDYDLGINSETGLDIASTLRQKIYTDMIFYSGKRPQDLRKMLFDSEVDGVFVVNRADFVNEIEPILEDHIKKMTDINNIRGVVMSAMSDVDNHMRGRMLALMEQELGANVDLKANLLENMKERAKKRLDTRLKSIGKIDSLENLVLSHHLTDFDLVRVALKSLFGKGTSEEELLTDNSLLHKLQKERNMLAHRQDSYTEDGRLLLSGNNGEESEYNMDEFKRLRRELLEVKSRLGCK